MDAIYIGGANPPVLPLARYLPVQPEGVFTRWLQEHVPAGSLVLDPLCAHPWTAIEAARAGYRVIACCNNPIVAFLLQMLSSAPSREDFQSVLAELAAARRNNTRLEQTLQDLYMTECPNCNRLVAAEAYIWQSDGEFPSARLLDCPHCGTEGEFTTTPGDIARYSRIGSDTLHRARALQRVASPADVYYENAVSALEVYAKRPLYVIFTILNKIESLSMPAEQKRQLHALLLPVLDQGNALWQHPPQRARPRQLSTPPLVRENNLWLALENSIDLWTVLDEPVTVHSLPDLPGPGEISILAGRFRQLFPLPEGAVIEGVLTTIPRPGQAFWTLCALWSGWLWGREAVTPLRSALQRLRYDWNWHARALKATFRTLGEQIPNNTPIFACAPEMEPGFLTATLVAANAAGLRVNAMALREEVDILQVDWRRRENRKKSGGARLQLQMRQKMTEHLAQRGEPAPYLTLLAAALADVDIPDTLSEDSEGLPHNYTGQVQTNFREVFNTPEFLPTVPGTPENLESTHWYMPKVSTHDLAPRFDRLERALVQYLLKHELASLADVETAVFAELRGLNTPTPSEIRLILESYGEAHARVLNSWQLKERERPSVRRQEVQSAAQDLAMIGEQLNYRVVGDAPIRWLNEAGDAEYCFHILASSIVSSVIYQTPAQAARQQVIVLPGSRCNLLSYKLKEDPPLAQAFAGWHTLKFRHLRNIAKRDDLSQAVWIQLLDSDPPCWEDATQKSIFPEPGELPLFPTM